jgi:hypothetical protein
MYKNKYSRWKNTYKFDIHDYNLVDEIYHALKANDRVIFVSRHAERWLDYWKYWGLLPSWVKQAKDLWKRLSWWKLKDTKNDFYWSTFYKRTVETSFYLWESRWYKKFIEKKELKEDWEEFNQVQHPIREVYEYYFWEETEHRYEENRVEWNKKSLTMLADLCELTEWHDFSWITTHDVFLMPLISWLSEEHIKFRKEEWINYLSWVAVIVHENKEYEVYPFRSLKDRSMSYING